jgi:hypothetical protein
MSPQSTAEQHELKSQFMKVRTEMNATSSQDEFAKWAKLRRQHDKLVEQLEKTSPSSPTPSLPPQPHLTTSTETSSDSTKATFDRVISAVRWLSTKGLRMLVQYWYMKQPMFWIPKDWVPYYAEWLLSFPRAPLGSVSVNVWVMACVAGISLVSDALVAVVALVTQSSTAPARGAAMKVPGEKTQAKGAMTKKEL